MNCNPESVLKIYSPVMASAGYFLIIAMFLGGPVITVPLAFLAALGTILFMDYMKEKSRFWWAGIFYPLLLILIIIIEIFSLASSGPMYGPGMTPGRLRGILFFLIAPVSLFFFLGMTQEFRKVMRVPLLFAVIISIFMLVPVYDEISNAYFPSHDGAIIASDVTAGFIILIMCGVCGLPLLGISGIIMGLKLSKIISSDLCPKKPEETAALPG
ncbi:hypothetical protein F1737_11500 [Methanoplanus sp. FWC-SCC4]|uniref:Uncharacterized protein n=1 Tax=Methanochimaera problematica TaxID=2609417 RepID=A0AA97FGZ8_9EURY|nr:hypothetical protein [Methanoplanus sp. FWC-SCC4]WOF17256.1 hypothetical protein F1737_11500 [Methanoplanus sp. FWC-SCC4]